jgi:hypothetical protein
MELNEPSNESEAGVAAQLTRREVRVLTSNLNSGQHLALAAQLPGRFGRLPNRDCVHSEIE